jgi:CrcB protein
MKALLIIFLGGGLGSIFRFIIYKLMNNGNYNIPYGTFVANITGSLILGFLLGYSLKNGNLSQNTLLFLTTGFCGGFTTFSTFAFENQAFLRAGDYLNFAIYGFGSLLLGIAAVMLGLFASKFF